jgi:hypothetical protein
MIVPFAITRHIMAARVVLLFAIVGYVLPGEAWGQAPRNGASLRRLDFNALPGDERVCAWLVAVSPSFREVYHATIKRPGVKGIVFKTVRQKPLAFSEIGVFVVDDSFEIRLSHELSGAERVKTLAFEVANAYLNEEHRQIDAGAAKGFFDAREFAIAHEIYEYEAWRVYRRFLFDLEKELGDGNLPPGLFDGPPAKKVADYKLPPLHQHLKHMEDSGHMQHYLSWFEKYYAGRRVDKR